MIWNTNSNFQATPRPTFIHDDSNTANTVPTCVCLSGCSTHTLILGVLDDKCHIYEGCLKFSLIRRKCTTPKVSNKCGHENQLALTWKWWMSKQGALSVGGCSLERLWVTWHSSSVVCHSPNSVNMPQMSTDQTGALDTLKPNKNKIKQFPPDCQSKGEGPREDNWILKDMLSAAVHSYLSRSISLIPIINSSPMVPAYSFYHQNPQVNFPLYIHSLHS